jgi:hypothetical protein
MYTILTEGFRGFPQSLFGKLPEITSGHIQFLLDPFQFIIHVSYQPVYYRLDSESAVKYPTAHLHRVSQ